MSLYDKTPHDKIPAWVARLRDAAQPTVGAEASQAALLTLASAVVPDAPAWAQDVVRTLAGEGVGSTETVRRAWETAARYAVCQVGALRIAIPVEVVLEVKPGGGYAALPGMASFVRGVANVKGEAITVIGLAELLQAECGGGQGWERMLLVKPPAGPQKVGLVVDRVIDLALLAAPEPAEQDLGGELAAFLTHTCDFEDEAVRILDVEALLGSGVLEMLAQTRRGNR